MGLSVNLPRETRRQTQGDQRSQPWPGAGFGVGANGLAFWRGDLYVANTDRGRIVRIPIDVDGSAGVPATFVEDAAIAFADGIAFDVLGNLYVVNSLLANTLVRIGPEPDDRDARDRRRRPRLPGERGLRHVPRPTDDAPHRQRRPQLQPADVMAAEIGVPGVPLP
jgi:hypothetical protein